MPPRSRARVRRATLRDLDLLVRHRRDMWRDMGGCTPAQLDAADPVYRRWARQRLRSGRMVAFVAELPGTGPVASGCVWVRDRQPRPGSPERLVPYLLSMYTEPAHRGKGLAKAIVRAAIAWCREQGYARITLHASEQGRPVYLALGFERSWEMRLDLARPRRCAC